MLRPSTELCEGWRQPTLAAVGDYVRGPDTPAGFHFFGRPVYRTFIQARVNSTINIVSIPWGGLVDLVDVWGCGKAQVTGTVQGVLHLHGFNNAGWTGAGAVRVRIKPDQGVLEIVSGAILEFGGSSESRPFPDTDLELVVFWTK